MVYFGITNVDLKIKYIHVCITAYDKEGNSHFHGVPFIMRGNFGQQLQKCLKLPRIRVGK